MMAHLYTGLLPGFENYIRALAADLYDPCFVDFFQREAMADQQFELVGDRADHRHQLGKIAQIVVPRFV